MKKTILAGLAALVLTTAAQAQPADAGTKLRVLLTFGGHDFQEKEFFAFWDALPGITYTKAPLPRSADLLKPGLEKQYDVIVLYDMAKGLTPEQRKDFVALLERGIGVVSLHHNLGANSDWDEYRKIIGGKWVSGNETLDGRAYAASTYSHGEELPIAIADKDHPITKGLADFMIHDETYGGVYVAPGVHVLLTTNHPKNVPPIAWTTHHGKSRVVYYMAGHDAEAWKNPSFRTIVERSIRWVARGG